MLMFLVVFVIFIAWLFIDSYVVNEVKKEHRIVEYYNLDDRESFEYYDDWNNQIYERR